MDESTANLGECPDPCHDGSDKWKDHATDMAIQKVLRSEMADVQMLIVAHRLATVAGLDKSVIATEGLHIP